MISHLRETPILVEVVDPTTQPVTPRNTIEPQSHLHLKITINAEDFSYYIRRVYAREPLEPFCIAGSYRLKQ